MRPADGVVALPVTRDLILRVARAHAQQRRPIQPDLFASSVHQAAYERAYHEHARQLEAEVAECA